MRSVPISDMKGSIIALSYAQNIQRPYVYEKYSDPTRNLQWFDSSRTVLTFVLCEEVMHG